MSPELFFSRDGDAITTRPMKGTTTRGRGPAEDEMRRDAMLASHAITAGPGDFGPVWSPDGTKIAFVDASRTVDVMKPDGSGRYAVHPGGTQFVPAWQPRAE